MGESTRTVEFRNETRIASLCLAGRRLHLTTTERCPLPWELGRTRLPRVVATHATMAVRAGCPSSGSGGLEAYAIPIFGLIHACGQALDTDPDAPPGQALYIFGSLDPNLIRRAGIYRVR